MYRANTPVSPAQIMHEQTPRTRAGIKTAKAFVVKHIHDSDGYTPKTLFTQSAIERMNTFVKSEEKVEV